MEDVVSKEIYLLLVLSTIISPTAYSEYDPKAAVKYAKDWCGEGKYNPFYSWYERDCANFVSLDVIGDSPLCMLP